MLLIKRITPVQKAEAESKRVVYHLEEGKSVKVHSEMEYFSNN